MGVGMRMIVMRMFLRCAKVTIVTGTGLILHLHRGMRNLASFMQVVMNAVQQRVMVVRRNHLHMQR